MPGRTYGTFCALSKACEVIEPRWTLLLLNAMWSGNSRFNDLRRAVGNISPAILSRRLAELETAGLVERVEDAAKGTVEYIRTAKAVELEEAMNALATWAQRNIDADVVLHHYDLSHMMWSIRKIIRTEHFPQRRTAIRFHFTDEGGRFPTYWLVYHPGAEPEMSIWAPNFDIDLYVEASKVSLNAIFLGRSTVSREIAAGRLFASGDARLERTMEKWLPRSAYAEVRGTRQL
ncbi:MAG: winged helix-turn-helix transcriptional regulator [Paracoccaceae bacterium]